MHSDLTDEIVAAVMILVAIVVGLITLVCV